MDLLTFSCPKKFTLNNPVSTEQHADAHGCHSGENVQWIHVPILYDQAIRNVGQPACTQNTPFVSLLNTHTHTKAWHCGSCYTAPQGSTDKPRQLTRVLQAELGVIFIICVKEVSAE